MISEFGTPVGGQTHWTHNETIDAEELRMFVNTQVQNTRQCVAQYLNVYYDCNGRGVKGISPDDCKILSHEIVDFLLKDEGQPISVRKQCVQDAVAYFPNIIKNSEKTFVNDQGYLKPSKLFDSFIQECAVNLHLFNCIEGRIQHQTSFSRKIKM